MKPLVAIHCLVYNHESYLRDCFEGFVMQQTNFPFVAIVHDDASTDGSAAIIREYEEKYPHIFKPIYETENQFSKQDGSLECIMDNAIISTGAKYVAMCEGDDYWIDPLKLQKQVDFLEANPEYSICFHKVNTLISSTSEIKEEFLVQDMPGKSVISNLAERNYIHTPSVVYRRDFLSFDKIELLLPCIPFDYVLWMMLAERGPIYKINEYMAIYRYGSGFWESSSLMKRNVLTLCTLNKLSVILHAYQPMLKKQINQIQEELWQTIMKKDMDSIMVRKSHAYQLGSILLSPLKKIKRIIK